MRLPQALRTDDNAAAVSLLEEYYGTPLDDRRGYTGAAFDTWDPAGTRGTSVDVFTADDVAAVTLLSVRVSGRAAHELLVRRADEMNALLADVPADLDLVDVDEPIGRDWAGSQLFHALRTLPGVGSTTATKLIARKRPRLRPVWDSVIAAHLDARQYIEPLRLALREDGGALHHRLARLRTAADLDEAVTPLRVFDVVAWLEGKRAGRVVPEDDEVADECDQPSPVREPSVLDGCGIGRPTSSFASPDGVRRAHQRAGANEGGRGVVG